MLGLASKPAIVEDTSMKARLFRLCRRSIRVHTRAQVHIEITGNDSEYAKLVCLRTSQLVV